MNTGYANAVPQFQSPAPAQPATIQTDLDELIQFSGDLMLSLGAIKWSVCGDGEQSKDVANTPAPMTVGGKIATVRDNLIAALKHKNRIAEVIG